MPEPDLRRVEGIFSGAVERPEVERAAYVAAECGGDGALLAAVRRMLRALERAGPFLDGATVGDGADREAPGPGLAEGPGTRIGPYKLLEQIGEGGFGVVFMAEQTEPVVRRVALKVIKAGMDTRQVIARFEAERQALAMMDHPNIARVLDAGATDTGRPYFVMELVRGDPITEYCDKNNLTTGERLALFTDVCHAVQHAHQKGIIHRDIKPGNVLVTLFDGKPIPKVIDFGIAKAVNQRLTDKTLFTAHRQLIGTPQYMSPEQAEMSGVDIDTRSDIYSLGVLLYELLTGTTPFDPEHLRSAALAEVQRIIREEEPEKPSTRLSQGVKVRSQGVKVSRFQGVKGKPLASPPLDTSTPRHLDTSPPDTPTPRQLDTSAAAAHRRTDAAQLVRAVRGDLDWIVMKCLEKDRTRRYETANGLAADVGRHLNGEPVVAAPPSRAYRVRKFLRRNRGLVTTASLVAAALVSGLAGTATFAVREASARAEAEHQRRAADAARVEADSRAAETEQVAAFQAEMLGSINATRLGVRLMDDLRERHAASLTYAMPQDQSGTPRTEIFARELARVNSTDAARVMIDETILRPSLAVVETRFEGQPLVAATLRQTIAGVYRALGLYEAAWAVQERALADRRRLLGEDHPSTLWSMGSAVDLLVKLRRFPEAEPLAREVVERRRALSPEGDLRLYNSVAALGVMLLDSAGPEAAEPLLREALEGLRSLPDPPNGDIASTLDELGTALTRLGRFEEAEHLMREMLDRSAKVWSEDDPRSIERFNTYGDFLFMQQRYAEAERVTREVLARARRNWGDDHPNTIGSIWNLGFLLFISGQTEAAEPYFRELLERRARVYGENHPDTLFTLDWLGIVLLDQGRPAEAEPILRDAAARRAAVLGPEHADTLRTAAHIGESLTEQGRLDEAEALLRPTLATAQRVLGPSHVTTNGATAALGRLLLATGELQESEALMREVVEKNLARLGENRAGTTRARTVLGEVLTRQGRFAEAEPHLLRAEKNLPGAIGANPRDYRRCLEALIALYEGWDRAERGRGFDARAAHWRTVAAETAGAKSGSP